MKMHKNNNNESLRLEALEKVYDESIEINSVSEKKTGRQL